MPALLDFQGEPLWDFLAARALGREGILEQNRPAPGLTPEA